MALTGTKCIQHVEHTLGGELSPAIDGLSLVNDAGEFFSSIRPWKWLETAEAKLDLRAKITITGATTSSGAGTTLTKSNAFTNYTFLEGDQIEVTSGTNVTAGWHRVQSKTDASNLVLATSPGASGSAVAATLHTSAVALPSDFREMISINTTSGLLKGVQLTGFQDLLNKRASNFVSTGFHYGAIVQPTDTDVAYDGAPVARLEIWPQPDANETASLTLLYRAGWKRLTEVKDYLRLPVYCEPLFLQVIRAFARGYEEEDGGSLSARLGEVMSGPLFVAAVDRDASIQPHYGPVHGGAAEMADHRSAFRNFNTVTGPS
tara:strand:+ start:10069 stop:11025 length:957 start_codon:yes stop_codon:yes gene_type:complete